ncbi:MAG TPA: PD-(D/E)XK nuclease family protein, partial [Thermoanaerobaculia bacterium]
EQFRRLLARASSREITLSWATISLKDRRERFPSPVLLDIYRTSTGNATAKFEDMDEVAKENFVDRQPLSLWEWWLYRRFDLHPSDLRDAILAAYPGLATGAEAEAARDSDAITPWDGKIAAGAAALDPRLNGAPYSASGLETMASCPYRYFLGRILRVHPLEELEFDPDTWLNALDFGTMIHEVLEATMNEICEAGRKTSLAFLPRMKEIAATYLESWRANVPPPSETAFERQRDLLLDSCEIFLRTEERECGEVTPKFFELPFDDFRLPLGRGKSVTLRGFIDRVDYDEARDEWHVWDYKSGSTYQFERGGRLQCGTKIQHAIYARAVEEKTGGRVTKSGYYFPTPQGAGARITRECTNQELSHALNLLFDTVAEGYYPHCGAGACTWCDFTEICGDAKKAAQRTERKIEANGSDPAVEAWLDLQEVK